MWGEKGEEEKRKLCEHSDAENILSLQSNAQFLKQLQIKHRYDLHIIRIIFLKCYKICIHLLLPFLTNTVMNWGIYFSTNIDHNVAWVIKSNFTQ